MAAFSRFIWFSRSLRDRRGGAALSRRSEASRRTATYDEEFNWREPAGNIREERTRAPNCVRVLDQEGTHFGSGYGREICKRLLTVRNIRRLPGNAQKVSRLRSGHTSAKDSRASGDVGGNEKTRFDPTGIRSDCRTA